jgi:PhnB protein
MLEQQKTTIAPMLAVRGGAKAIDFYKKAFGAEELWRIVSDDHVVAGLTVEGAPFFLADESPEHGQRSPDSMAATTVRIELFVKDPKAVATRAVAAGATELAPVIEHQYETVGIQPIHKILQGAIRDPFGHIWLIGRILD